MKRDSYESVVSCIIENQDRFYRLAFSYVQNADDALDAVQNAACKALENYRTMKNPKAVKTWLYRIVINESLLLLRERRKFVFTEDRAQIELPYEEKGFLPAEDLYGQINRLPEDVQSTIKLRFYEELQLKEIAQVMQMNLNTVKAKLYRGLKTLKLTIQEVDL